MNYSATATGFVAKGSGSGRPRPSSSLFNWAHIDFVKRFPDHEKLGKHIDHIISRKCAIQTDGTIDQEFARLVLGLDNLQLLTAQANVFKGANIDKRILATCKRYREVEGLSGADLFRDLWHQFHEQATNLDAMPSVAMVEDAPLSRWPSIQGLLFQEATQ